MGLTVTVTTDTSTVYHNANPQKWAAVFVEWVHFGTNSGMAVDTAEGRIEVSEITGLSLEASR